MLLSILFLLLLTISTYVHAQAMYDTSVCYLETADSSCFYVQPASGCNGQQCSWTLNSLTPPQTGCQQDATMKTFTCDNSIQQSVSIGSYACVCGGAMNANVASKCSGRCDSIWNAPRQSQCNIAQTALAFPYTSGRGNFTGSPSGGCLYVQGTQDDPYNVKVIDGNGLVFTCNNTVQTDDVTYICNCGGAIDTTAFSGITNGNQCGLQLATNTSVPSPAQQGSSTPSSSAASTPTYDPNSYSSFKFRVDGYSALQRPTKNKGGDGIQVVLALQGGNVTDAGLGTVLTQPGPLIKQSNCKHTTGDGTTLQFQLGPNSSLALALDLLYVKDSGKSRQQIQAIADGLLATVGILGRAITRNLAPSFLNDLIGSAVNNSELAAASQAIVDLAVDQCQGSVAARKMLLNKSQVAMLPYGASFTHVDHLYGNRPGDNSNCFPAEMLVRWMLTCTENCPGTLDTLQTLQSDPSPVDIVLPQKGNVTAGNVRRWQQDRIGRADLRRRDDGFSYSTSTTFVNTPIVVQSNGKLQTFTATQQSTSAATSIQDISTFAEGPTDTITATITSGGSQSVITVTATPLTVERGYEAVWNSQPTCSPATHNLKLPSIPLSILLSISVAFIAPFLLFAI